MTSHTPKHLRELAVTGDRIGWTDLLTRPLWVLKWIKGAVTMLAYAACEIEDREREAQHGG